MIALLSVWIGLASLLLAGTMVLYRPAMTDIAVTLVLYFASPGAMCLAGMVLWSLRKDRGQEYRDNAAIQAQRFQAKVAIALAFLAAAFVYILIIRSTKLEPVADEPTATIIQPMDRSETLAG